MTSGGKGSLGERIAPVWEELQAIPNVSILVQTVQNVVPSLSHRDVAVSIEVITAVLRMSREKPRRYQGHA